MSKQSLLDKAFLSALKVEKPLCPSEWADSYRYLSTASSSEPGLWRTSRTPYIKEILDCMSSDGEYAKVRRVCVMKGHQLGYTEGVIMNALGWIVSENPCPSMLVAPSEKAVKKILQQKIDPMILDSPVVRAKISTYSRGQQRNTMIHKDFSGGFLVLAGATIPNDLASTSVRMLFLDEVDRMPLDTGGEGSPVELAIGRTSAYNRRKIMMGSTPAAEETSVINKHFLEGDQRYFYVPCPFCKHMQIIAFDRLHWEPGIYTSVWLECEKCNKKIHEKHKTIMLAGGQWRPTNKDHKDETTRSYHLSSLYSPIGFLSWSEIARGAERADRDEHYKKTFYNLFLGLPCSMTIEEVPNPRSLYKKGKHYTQDNWDGIDIKKMFITAGADVQGDRIEVLVVGWIKRRAWILEHIVFWGKTNTDPWVEPWTELSALMEKKYGNKKIHRLAIDAGYIPHRVFSWLRYMKQSRRLRAVRGTAYFDAMISQPKLLEVAGFTGKRSKVGNKYFDLNTHLLKQETYKRLLVDEDAEDCVLFPDGLTREFYEQLCSERMVRPEHVDLMDRTGYPKYKWVAIRQRNEALDMFVYALGMWYASNAARYLDRWDVFIDVRDQTLA